MGKNKDLIVILLIVVIGMFIPFFGSQVIMYDCGMMDIDCFFHIGKTFGWFLLIFAIELGFVYLYFYTTNILAQKKIDKQSFIDKK